MTALALDAGYNPPAAPLPLHLFEPVSLHDVVERADLATRVDRKYFLDVNTVRLLAESLSNSHRILDIDGRRSTTYATTYFDTEDFASCRAHVQRRRRRWKVRSRMYVEDDFCRVEVKTKSGRGQTLKDAVVSHPDRYGSLGGDERAFVANTLSDAHPEVDVARLDPSAEITYTRACLADLADGTRLTIDWGLRSVLSQGKVRSDEAFAIVETKGGQVPSGADRLLASLGATERSFSKYAATTSLVHPDIADNDVRRLRGIQLHCTPSNPDQGD